MNVRLALIAFVMLTAVMLSIHNVQAQASPTPGGVDLTASLESPLPGQDVLITARSYSTNINAATVVWTVNGRVVARGVGITTLTIKAPKMGEVTEVIVTLTSPDGIEFQNSIAISSGSIDFIVESNGYVPPFFAGKIPVAYQNVVKVIAVPHLAGANGVEYDPKTLIYKWEQGTTVLESQSGYGKQAVILPGSIIPRTHQVKVTVTTRDGSNSTSRIAAIGLTAPAIGFYRNDPLYGPMYNTAVSQNLLIGRNREVSVVAVPFGFNLPAEGIGSLALKWMINNTLKPELAQNRTITLRAPAGAAGASNVTLTIENTQDILQTAETSFTALFTATDNATTTPLQF